MTNSNVPQIVYLMGHPYSGSTLFALALGNSDGVTNLGEVSYLENDYNPNSRCICGESLSNCDFWTKVQMELRKGQNTKLPNHGFSLEVAKGLDVLHRRDKGIGTKLRMQLGIKNAFPRAELDTYVNKHAQLFHAVARVSPQTLMVDASKNPHRLNLLLERSDLEIKVIWLRRSMSGLFKSKVKRLKRRATRYNSLALALYSIGWLLAYQRLCDRTFEMLEDSSKAVVWYEDFVTHPTKVEQRLNVFLRKQICFYIDEQMNLEVSDQHVYTGNRWLRRRSVGNIIAIRSTSHSSPMQFEDRIFALASPFFRSLNE